MDSEYVNRDVGQFPLSIGTSMALEGLLGVHPNQPKQPGGYKNIKSLWINLRTLVRNLHSAIKAEDLKRIQYVNAVAVLIQEINSIPQILANAGSSVTPTLYLEDAHEFKWLFPNAALKQAKTDKQAEYATFEALVTKMLIEHLDADRIPWVVVKKKPELQRYAAIMLTHQPHQLLWQHSFERLMLLESHTGKIKIYNIWYTKLNGITEDNPMPFNRYTLQVFGDGQLFDMQPKAIRDELKQLAGFKRWTGLTSQMKMSADILSSGSQNLKKNYAELNP